MPKKLNLSVVYYALSVIGFILTWAFNGQYLLEGGGLGPRDFFGAAFANPLTTAITLDVYLSALVFSVWVACDSSRLGNQKYGGYIALCFCVGLAVAFPLYLARRETSAQLSDRA